MQQEVEGGVSPIVSPLAQVRAALRLLPSSIRLMPHAFTLQHANASERHDAFRYSCMQLCFRSSTSSSRMFHFLLAALSQAHTNQYLSTEHAHMLVRSNTRSTINAGS